MSSLRIRQRRPSRRRRSVPSILEDAEEGLKGQGPAPANTLSSSKRTESDPNLLLLSDQHQHQGKFARRTQDDLDLFLDIRLGHVNPHDIPAFLLRSGKVKRLKRLKGRPLSVGLAIDKKQSMAQVAAAFLPSVRRQMSENKTPTPSSSTRKIDSETSVPATAVDAKTQITAATTETPAQAPAKTARKIKFKLSGRQVLDVALQEAGKKGKGGSVPYLREAGRQRYVNALLRTGQITKTQSQAYCKEDSNFIQPERRLRSASRGEVKVLQPVGLPPTESVHGILKPITVNQHPERVYARIGHPEYYLTALCDKEGGLFARYDEKTHKGKPMNRVFRVRETEHGWVFSWSEPSFLIFSRSHELLVENITHLYYGPFYSKSFLRFIERKDGASGMPWLAFSVEFRSKTIHMVCKSSRQLRDWFLGLQGLAPLSVTHKTRGKLLWDTLILKLNWYGLARLKQVVA